jgi:Helix-turn-helix domain
MSIAAIERAYALDISPTEQRVLLVIAKHCDENGHNGYPSVGLIAWMLGLKERQVQRTLHGLVDQKILAIAQAGGGRGRTTHYFFDLHAGPVKTPFKPEYMRRNGVTDSTPFNGNGVIASTPFTDNQPVMTGVSVQTVSQPVHPLTETVSSDELKGVLPELKGVICDVKGVIASTPESTLKNLKDHHQGTRARDEQERRGGGGDDGIRNDEENLPEDSHQVESDAANVKADLVDALVNLGIRPGSARQVVMDRIVASDRDVVLCKRFIEASTANNPPAVLWSQYLSVGRLPAAPIAETTSTTPDWMKQRAQEYLAETEARNADGDTIRDKAYDLSQLTRDALKAIDRPSRVSTPPANFWRST